MELKDFSRNPKLRELLVNYCLTMYEENAIIDDEHLILEYNWLLKNDELSEMFYIECLNKIEAYAVTRYS